MKVIRPTPATTAALLAHSVPEADYAEWDAGTSYALGARVIKAATHRIYQAATASVNQDPATSPAKWTDVGPTNRWAMLDQAVGTETVGTGTITLTIAAGTVSSLAVLDTNADTVRVLVTVDGATLYDQTAATNVSGGAIGDWYSYFLSPTGKVATLVFDGLPLYAQAQIQVTVTGPNPSGPVSVGTLIVGNVVDLGTTEAGPSIGIVDYSRKVTDDFGVTTVVERPWSKRMTTRSLIETSAVDGIQRTLAGLRAQPALWLGESGYDSLTIYGFFKDFSIDLTLASMSYVSLTVEGLI